VDARLVRDVGRRRQADVAGRVEAVGSNVKQFKPGDEVFGYLPSATGRGTFAEYVCANDCLASDRHGLLEHPVHPGGAVAIPAP
jgi:NADPH:quinone reductase-like Zn-dependent oxidoreductase